MKCHSLESVKLHYTANIDSNALQHETKLKAKFEIAYVLAL